MLAPPSPAFNVTPRSNRYLDQTATVTAIVVAILLTDHLFSPIGTTVKQLTFARPHLVQKPCVLSFQVPALLLPDCARGSRVIFPSGVNNTTECGSGEGLAVEERRLDVAWSHGLGSEGCARVEE